MGKLILFSILVGSLLSSGCATMTRGTTEEFTVESDPDGADVRLSDGQSGTTPAVFVVPRKGPLIVEVEKECFKPVKANIASTVSSGGGAGMAGNIIFGGLIGAAVDGTSGAMNDRTPNPLLVKLKPIEPCEVKKIAVAADKGVRPEKETETIAKRVKVDSQGQQDDTQSPHIIVKYE